MSLSRDCVSDLAARWTSARRAALLSCLDHAEPGTTESELIARAVAQRPAAAKRALFDNSLRLGRGFRRFHGATIALQDLPALLPELQSACTDGVLQVAKDRDGLLLLRQGCAMRALGPVACELWHEALHGLFLGLTNGLYHTRHSSQGRGSRACVDAFHAEGSSLRYGPIAEDDQLALAQVTDQLRRFDPGSSLEFLGVNDATLHYRATPGVNSQLCLRSHVERMVRKRLPHRSVLEISARPGLAG